jgi:predicted alpha/beta hydrolase
MPRPSYPVLALTFADDELLPRPARAAARRLPSARVDYRLIEPARHGLKRIGHFGFFKPQCEMNLWPLVAEWLDHAGGGRRGDQG